MAYSFPPRGFNPSPVLPGNDRQFIPQFGNSSLLPPEASRPPNGHRGRFDRPPFNAAAEVLPFGRFPHHQNACERFGPRSLRDWSGPDARAVSVRPLAMPGRFPPPPPIPPNANCHWVDIAGRVTGDDITGSWSGSLPGRGVHGMQRCPGDSWKASKTSRHQNARGGSSAMVKHPHKGTSAKKHNRQNSNSTNKNVTGEDRPEHRCDVCDRGFKTKESLDAHLSQHVKCLFEGCKFKAHAKIVKLHTKLQHGKESKKITWFDTPSEVERWREERKRNYPSASNIANKIDTKTSDEDQGIALQNKYFGKMRRPKWRQQNAMGNHAVPTKRTKADDFKSNGGVKPKSALTTCNEDSGTKVTPSSPPEHHQQVELASSSNLGSLSALASYGGDSEVEQEEGEIREDTPEAEEDKRPPAELKRSIRERKWNVKRMRQKKTRRGTRSGKKVQQKKQDKEIHARLRRRPNLLEMLLAPEIRRERNIILQCVRHIVQNNFFGVNQTKTTAAKPVPERGFPVVMEESSTSRDSGLTETQKPYSGQTKMNEVLPTEVATKAEMGNPETIREKSEQGASQIEEGNPLTDNRTEVDKLDVQMQPNQDMHQVHPSAEDGTRDHLNIQTNQEQPQEPPTMNGNNFDKVDLQNIKMHPIREDSQLREADKSITESLNPQTTYELPEQESCHLHVVGGESLKRD